MGRILRKKISKARSADGFDAYFYTLLSLDTSEMYFSEKRRRYLVAQGYEYHVRPFRGEVARDSGVASFFRLVRFTMCWWQLWSVKWLWSLHKGPSLNEQRATGSPPACAGIAPCPAAGYFCVSAGHRRWSTPCEG